MPWGRITWSAHDNKHFAHPSIEWSEHVLSTRHGAAKYHVDVRIEELELSIVAHVKGDGEELTLTNGRPVAPGANYKLIYMIFPRIIGAYLGEPTDIVLAKWDPEPLGTLHGHPISETDLKKRLKNNPDELQEYKNWRERIRRGVQ